tara:strand:- start:600 stop:941 length:342 start_codon:yes stop_codon:yes gene_type:complete
MSLFQILAAFPGISRSGITIGIGLLFGLGPRKAVIISLIMSAPVILLASIYDLYNIFINNYDEKIFGIIISFLFSLIFSFIGIKLMMLIARKYNFKWFSIYNILVGVAVLIFL